MCVISLQRHQQLSDTLLMLAAGSARPFWFGTWRDDKQEGPFLAGDGKYWQPVAPGDKIPCSPFLPLREYHVGTPPPMDCSALTLRA